MAKRYLAALLGLAFRHRKKMQNGMFAEARQMMSWLIVMGILTCPLHLDPDPKASYSLR